MESFLLRVQLFVKNFFDVCLSAILVVTLLPFFLIISLVIKIDSKGSIFFIQKRPGLGGELFKVYKFRTMNPGSDIMVKGQEVGLDDDRITKFGKFLRRYKIDELPQLFNVLKGEMSLIGPRPERVESLKDYSAETRKRLNMKPGLTGLAQVSGNICIPLEHRYKYDVYYVENFSIWLDICIIVRTIGVVLRGEGKYVDRQLVPLDELQNYKHC